MKKLVLFSIILVLALAGCRSQSTLAATPTPAFLPPANQNPAMEINFKDQPAGWCQGSSFDFGDFSCQNAELHAINKGVGSVAGMCGDSYKNFMLQAQVRLVGKTGAYGVEFRGDNDQPHFYIFMLHPDGRYQLIKWASGQITVLIPWTASTAIKQGEAANLLQVKAQGEQLTLYANNQQLDSINDSAYVEGCVGPVALEDGHAATSSIQVWELP